MQSIQQLRRLLPRRLLMFSCLTGGLAGSGGTMGDASNLRLPASMLAHTVQLWTCESMFKRAAFLAEECRNLRQAEVLCLHALRRSEKTRDRHDYAHVETLFQFACFHQQFKGDLDTAEAFYQRVLDASPQHVGALCNYGLLHHTAPNKRWEQAEDMYERALEIDSRHCNTLCNYAALQLHRDDGKGNPRHCTSLYEEAIAYAPRTARVPATPHSPRQEHLKFEALAGSSKQ